MDHPKLHPEVRRIFATAPAQLDLGSPSLDEIRAAPLVMAAAPEPVGGVVQRSIRGDAGWIRLRIYSPQGAGPHPALVFMHGGGFVVGSLDGTDRLCRSMTNSGGAVVISVDYRLSPETKFPGALDDVLAALVWTRAAAAELNVDPLRIGVGGISAGGNLAAAAALLARDRAIPVAFQLLLVPMTDRRCDSPSMIEFADGPAITRTMLQRCWAQYLDRPEDGTNPYASVVEAADLRGLPPAFVVTAECDVLCSEGERYAERLREADVATTHRRYAGMPHGFLGLPSLDETKRALTDIGAALRAHL
jgi:acetyl esterase